MKQKRKICFEIAFVFSLNIVTPAAAYVYVYVCLDDMNSYVLKKAYKYNQRLRF